MTIWHDRPVHFADGPMDATEPSLLHVRRSEGTAGALSSTGLVAVIGATSAYLSGLSTSARDAIADRMGLTMSASRTEVVVPVAPGDASALAATLATVLAAEGNVITDPSS